MRRDPGLISCVHVQEAPKHEQDSAQGGSPVHDMTSFLGLSSPRAVKLSYSLQLKAPFQAMPIQVNVLHIIPDLLQGGKYGTLKVVKGSHRQQSRLVALGEFCSSLLLLCGESLMGTSALALPWSRLGVQREQGEAHAWDVEQGAA